MLIHLLDPLDTDRQSSDLDKKMLPCIVKQSNEYLYRIMPFWRRYCLCVWMAWGALRTQENGSLRALNFKFSWGSMPPNPPSLVGANHSRKILDPPLMNARSLKSIHYSQGVVNSARYNLHRFQGLVYTEDLDIVLVTETWLHRDGESSELLYSGYSIYRNDR